MQKNPITKDNNIKTISMYDEMSSSYLSYAMSVIISRALPDVRDGLKPVHRRIIYAMHKGGFDWSKQFRKSARIVGDVIGKYHPHGDQAVYDALVRMVQDFSMSQPLIDGQGNFGSIDGDPPAAMRYTETRLSKISQHLIDEIEKDTVEFKNNYESEVKYKTDSIRLDRPRDYWIAIPNETNLSMKDFQITLQVEFESIPKGHETIFSQSSILRINEEFNNQSWKWSIIDGRMYFFWIEDVTYGYSKFIGGQSLRSGKLISNNGSFDSIVSDFTLSQYDEITTSHNGFLTMAVEYGLFIVLIIVFSIFYLIYANFDRKNFFEIGLFNNCHLESSGK